VADLAGGGGLERVKPISLPEYSGGQRWIASCKSPKSSGEEAEKAYGREGEFPREGKAQEGRCLPDDVDHSGEEDICREQNPEAEVEANRKRVKASERAYGSADGNRP